MNDEAEYIIVSTAVTDEISLADGTAIGTFPGGAGVYALAGIRLWTEKVLLVTGVGEDFPDSYKEWFQASGCSQEGLLVKASRTAISHVQYQEDGERTEWPEYGIRHYQDLEATPEELESYFKNAKGVYIFKELKKEYWKKILVQRRKYKFRLMWEINAEVAIPEKRADVQQLAQHCDMISLNLTEAKRMFETEDLELLISILLDWKISFIFLRAGSKGAYVLAEERSFFIPSVKNIKVVDPTGAGNSSTAAILYGVCEGYSPQQCGWMGNISAARMIEQYGPPVITKDMREKAEQLLERMRKANYEKN